MKFELNEMLWTKQCLFHPRFFFPRIASNFISNLSPLFTRDNKDKQKTAHSKEIAKEYEKSLDNLTSHSSYRRRRKSADQIGWLEDVEIKINTQFVALCWTTMYLFSVWLECIDISLLAPMECVKHERTNT